MSEIEIIQTWMYHQRVIYFCKIDDKYQLFYKSTGLAGHDSKGHILPHYLLKETRREDTWVGDEFGGMPHMWIPKVYKKKDFGFVPYFSKEEDRFPQEMQEYMQLIRTLETPNMIEDSTGITIENSPFVINDFCREYIKNETDWKEW